MQRREAMLLALGGLFLVLGILTLTGVRGEIRLLEIAVPLVWAACMAICR